VIDRLRRLDAWLGARGIRRTVLLVVGCAGLAAALVAGVGAAQVGRVGGPARAGAVVDGAVADADRVQALFWRARFAGSSAGDASQPAIQVRQTAQQQAQQQVQQTVQQAERQVSQALGAAVDRSAATTAAERRAAIDAARSWARYLDVRRARPASSARVDTAAGDVVAGLDALAATARRAAGERADAAGRTYLRARIVLVLLLCLGLLGAAGLLRLLVGGLAGAWRRRVEQVTALLAPGPGRPRPAGDVERPSAVMTAVLRDAARRLEARDPGFPARHDLVSPDDGDTRWWLASAAPR